MTPSNRNITRQHRTGYTLLAGAGIVTVVGAAILTYYDASPIAFLGLLVPVVILGGFGYRNLAAARSQTALQDERTEELLFRTGHHSFWWLLNIIVVDSFLELIPGEGVRFIYVVIGLITFVVIYLYGRFVAPRLTHRWTTN